MKNQKSEDVKKAIEEVIGLGAGDETVEKLMQALDKNKILRYHKEDEISLLSTTGRVLVSLIEDPTMTIRAISVYLDLSETMIDKTVKQLISAGMITKTKVNRQNVYRLNDSMILKQPDIHHILAAINKIESSKKEIVQEQRVAEDELF